MAGSDDFSQPGSIFLPTCYVKYKYPENNWPGSANSITIIM